MSIFSIKIGHVKSIISVVLLLFTASPIFAQILSVRISDDSTNALVADAAVYIRQLNGSAVGTITDELGFTQLRVKNGKLTLYVSHVNYEFLSAEIDMHGDMAVSLKMVPKTNQIKEVVVTASESRGVSSASKINTDAMKHLQPSSFTEILSLLPGGVTTTPQMNATNQIRLREAGTSGSDYDVSSLGTQFTIDGAPISTDANMQYISQASSDNQGYYRTSVNSGVDMRTISTDDIEKVEVVRGIPSVEYGDLTSGLVKIERKLKPTPWEARFKSDGFGKLFYLGKGLNLSEVSTINLGLDFLNSKADPRNTLENYKRFTSSARMVNTWSNDERILKWRINLDYTGSFDNDKVDPDLNFMQEDSYRSQFNRISLVNNFTAAFNNGKLQLLQLLLSSSYQHDVIEQTRFIQLDRNRAMPSIEGEGVHNGEYLPFKYVADYKVDGKPLSIFVKTKAQWRFSLGNSDNRAIAGVEWKLDKNYGGGQIYDYTRPLIVGTTTRPRAYWEIPAGNQLSVYAEDDFSLPIHRNKLRVVAGIRSTSLLNLDRGYTMRGKIFLDPRINVQWKFPSISISGSPLNFNLSTGVGQHTKMPTLQQLYPAKYYKDIIQLNYYHANPEYCRLNIRTYVIDPTNFQLEPATNLKWEARLGVEYRKNDFSLTIFREEMNTGFRSSSVYLPFSYQKYDASGVDYNGISAPPEISELPYEDKKVLGGYSQTTNGSRILKEGIEFQFASQRFEKLRTRFTVNGAWFRTTYVNSQPMFTANANQVINNVSVNDIYVGYYDWNDGSIRELFNTNVIADTYIDKLGLTFSVTLQFQWYSSSQTMRKSGVPIAYMDANGVIHEYTAECQNDPYLRWLTKTFSEELFKRNKNPFEGYINFKASKTITKYATLAFFVDKLFDYLPDYTASTGVVIRRTATSYFGMEINIRL